MTKAAESMKLAITGWFVFLCAESRFQASVQRQGLDRLDARSARKARATSCENGVLVCPEDGGGNLLTEEEFDNFVFRFEFKLTPGGNNGVGIRAPLAGDIAYSGMEIQILDHGNEKYKGRV